MTDVTPVIYLVAVKCFCICIKSEASSFDYHEDWIKVQEETTE
uniref:Uncharacterized protein n=1 Tax=Anguilla anguilla TaxID=7936 RepID=A0A0E9WIL3_ANGAN